MVTEIWIVVRILEGLIDAIQAFKKNETGFSTEKLLNEIKIHVRDDVLPELKEMVEERVGG
ncbi:MAG: hypothetical protein HQM13_22910 [SAR324 cluster bacterium]|nr:hypothetical protein [SAR324 cluster bacterium]